MPCSRSPEGGGGIPVCLAGFQAHTQGASWGDLTGGSPGPHPRGEVEGDLARGSPDPHPRGKLRGIWPGGSPGPRLWGLC